MARPALLVLLVLAPLVVGCFPMPHQPATAAEAGVTIIEYVVTTPDAEESGVVAIAPGEWATTGTAEVKVRFRPAAGGFSGAVKPTGHGVQKWTCIVYESEGQQSPSARTCSELYEPVFLIEALGARVVPCDQAAQVPEPHCRRVPAGDVREAGGGRAWVLLSEAGPCPGRAG